jgi:hypothetical protein
VKRLKLMKQNGFDLVVTDIVDSNKSGIPVV